MVDQRPNPIGFDEQQAGRRLSRSGMPAGRSGNRLAVAKSTTEQISIAGNRRSHRLRRNSRGLAQVSSVIRMTKPDSRKNNYTPSIPLAKNSL